MPQIEHRSFGLLDLKVDASGAEGTLSGYGAVFSNLDAYGQIIDPGAFVDTLKVWGARGKLPKMLLQHGGWGLGSDDMMPIGKWESMTEDKKGLKVAGRLFAMNTERGQYIYEGLKSGELDGLSIGFEIQDSYVANVNGEQIRHLSAIDLWEVSIVTFPANDKARVSGVKHMLTPDEVRDLESALGERGVSCAQRPRAIAAFKAWLSREVGEPISGLREEDAPDLAALAAEIAGKMFSGAIKHRG